MSNVVDFNAKSRRALINGQAWIHATNIPESLTATDEDALALAISRLGDVAAAHLHGHTIGADEWLQLAAVALARVDRQLGGDAAA